MVAGTEPGHIQERIADIGAARIRERYRLVALTGVVQRIQALGTAGLGTVVAVALRRSQV